MVVASYSSKCTLPTFESNLNVFSYITLLKQKRTYWIRKKTYHNVTQNFYFPDAALWIEFFCNEGRPVN